MLVRQHMLFFSSYIISLKVFANKSNRWMKNPISTENARKKGSMHTKDQVPRLIHQRCFSHYSLPLKHDNFICLQVTELQLASFFYDVGVLANHEPSNVGKEESPYGVVGVCVRLRVLMVDPMVSYPLEDVILWIAIRC